MSNIYTEKVDTIFVVTMNRPEVRNAIDAPTASALPEVFREFDATSNFFRTRAIPLDTSRTFVLTY